MSEQVRPSDPAAAAEWATDRAGIVDECRTDAHDPALRALLDAYATDLRYLAKALEIAARGGTS